MRQAFLLYLYQWILNVILININTVLSQIILIVNFCGRHGSNFVGPTSEVITTKTVCKAVRIVSINKLVIFSPVSKSPYASNISISENVCCSVSCKPVSALISSEPVKSFVTC